MSSGNSTPDSTPPFSSSVTSMEAQRSAQRGSSQASLSSPIARGMSDTPCPESSQQRAQVAQVKKKKAPSLRRPQSVVTIYVGPEESKETFMIHKDIICHHSTFFAKAFSSNLHEGKTQTMNLPDVESDTFGMLVEWFYTQKLDLDSSDRDGNILLLAKLWSLAQRFAMFHFQNKVMDVLRQLVEGAEGEGLKGFLQYAYESSKGRSMLRRLAADRMAWATSAKGLQVWMSGGHLPDGLLIDIVMSLKTDHIVGAETRMKFGSFPSAKEYYIGVGEKMVAPKEERSPST